jgi:hypothetical protein
MEEQLNTKELRVLRTVTRIMKNTIIIINNHNHHHLKVLCKVIEENHLYV